MKNILKPWALVTLGIVFNIAAAVVTHYFIGLNNQKLENLSQKISSYDTLISSQWRIKTELDRAQEFLLLLLTLGHQESSTQSQNIDSLIQKKLSIIIKQHELQASVEERQIELSDNFDYGAITQILELSRQKIINSINDTYLDKLSIENQQSPIIHKNSLLLSVAIFLQVTGLILVLSRDLKN